MRTFIVRANWDAEADVWIATSEDVPGRATEADTVERLVEKLAVIVPELLELNGVVPNRADEIPIELLTQKHIQLKAGKAA
jgi:predicted RNase H-like HicB family nuclease